MTTTTTPTSGAAIKRYKIGYHSDEWGVRSSTPSGIPDASGPWVRYEDHVTALKAAQPVVTSQPGVAYEALPDPWREKLAELAGQLEKCGVAWMIRMNGGTTYNVGRADGARVATSELRKVLNDELVNMLAAAPTHQPAPQPSPAAQAAESVPALGREQERIAFKDAHRHLELDEVPDAWGRPMFKHSHVEASWLGWIARAARAPAESAQGDALSDDAVRVPLDSLHADAAGPKKWAPEEVEDGERGIRWVTNEGIHGRPTDHDVREYLKRTPTANGCLCDECKVFYAAAPTTQPAPQQEAQEPLTDGQIAEMMRETWGCASIAPRHALEFARVVERAHGIGIKGGQHGAE